MLVIISIYGSIRRVQRPPGYRDPFCSSPPQRPSWDPIPYPRPSALNKIHSFNGAINRPQCNSESIGNRDPHCEERPDPEIQVHLLRKIPERFLRSRHPLPPGGKVLGPLVLPKTQERVRSGYSTINPIRTVGRSPPRNHTSTVKPSSGGQRSRRWRSTSPP
jgi:hypothetical protein